MDNQTYSSGELNLIKELRRFWSQQVQWMRHFIISSAEELDDLPMVMQRLYANSSDFFYLLRVFFGSAQAERFARFLTFHMATLGQLIQALMRKDQAEADRLTVELNRNAREMAVFLDLMSPYWEEEQWYQLLYNLVSLTINEMVARIADNYEEDIEIYDRIEENAYNIADYLANGIIYNFKGQ